MNGYTKIVNNIKDKMKGINDVVIILEKPLPSDKWEFYYHYARKILDEEIQRYQKIDDKAMKFLTSVSTVFAVFSGVISWFFTNIFPPANNLDYLFCILYSVL